MIKLFIGNTSSAIESRLIDNSTSYDCIVTFLNQKVRGNANIFFLFKIMSEKNQLLQQNMQQILLALAHFLLLIKSRHERKIVRSSNQNLGPFFLFMSPLSLVHVQKKSTIGFRGANINKLILTC